MSGSPVAGAVPRVTVPGTGYLGSVHTACLAAADLTQVEECAALAPLRSRACRR